MVFRLNRVVSAYVYLMLWLTFMGEVINTTLTN